MSIEGSTIGGQIKIPPAFITKIIFSGNKKVKKHHKHVLDYTIGRDARKKQILYIYFTFHFLICQNTFFSFPRDCCTKQIH